MNKCAICEADTKNKTYCSNECRSEGTIRRNKAGLSIESINKMRASLTGKKMASKTKEKMSASRRAYLADHPKTMDALLEAVEEKHTSKIRGKGWRKARLRALERDNYTCQKCGETERRLLIVHHLDYQGKNMPSHTLMNNDLDNLVTWCHKCHNGFHRVKAKDYKERMNALRPQ